MLAPRAAYLLVAGQSKTLCYDLTDSANQPTIDQVKFSDGALCVSAADAAWLFDARITQTNGEYRVYTAEDMTAWYGAKCLEWGYDAGYGNNRSDYSGLRGVLTARKDGLYYLLDLEGNRLTGGYEGMGINCKMGVSFCSDSTSQWGLMDYSGNILISDGIGHLWEYTDTPYIIASTEDYQLYGLYDRAGNCIYPVEYEFIGGQVHDETINQEYYYQPLFGGRAVALQKDGKWGFGDFAGSIILPIEYDALGRLTDDVLQVYADETQTLLIVEKGDAYYTVDFSGTVTAVE